MKGQTSIYPTGMCVNTVTVSRGANDGSSAIYPTGMCINTGTVSKGANEGSDHYISYWYVHQLGYSVKRS